MKREKKTSQIIVRMTEKEKNFLLRKAEEEERTLSAIVNGALRKKYPKYKTVNEKEEKEKRND